METKMKRIVCLALAALLLFAFVACGGKSGKKDQIVHVGETVQYGRLKFKFVNYEVNEYNYEVSEYNFNEITVNLSCEKTSGNNEEYVFGTRFVFYEDGKETGKGGSFIKEVYPDRGPIEMSIRQSYNPSASRIEIDYRDDDYTREWGKLTFVIDLP